MSEKHLKLAKVRAGIYEVRSESGRVYRIQRLPARSRGWHAQLRLGPDAWTATRYSGRTLRDVARQMSEAGIRLAS